MDIDNVVSGKIRTLAIQPQVRDGKVETEITQALLKCGETAKQNIAETKAASAVEIGRDHIE